MHGKCQLVSTPVLRFHELQIQTNCPQTHIFPGTSTPFFDLYSKISQYFIVKIHIIAFSSTIREAIHLRDITFCYFFHRLSKKLSIYLFNASIRPAIFCSNSSSENFGSLVSYQIEHGAFAHSPQFLYALSFFAQLYIGHPSGE